MLHGFRREEKSEGRRVKEKILNELKELPAQVDEVDYRKRGYHLDLSLDPGKVRGFASIMRNHGFYPVFVTAVHLAPAIEVVYQFASYSTLCRIVARAPVSGEGSIPTISDIFQGANWHERETWEMFGVLFTGHPRLEPLLLPEDATELRPLLKTGDKVKTTDQLRRQTEAAK
jgi:NADH-quinone oxidoreductase subunit C